MSISFFLLPLFSVAAHSSETHGRYSALHRTVQYHTKYQKIVLIQQSHIGTKKPMNLLNRSLGY